MSRPARTRRSVCHLGFPSPSLVKSPYFSYHLLRCLHAAYWKQDWQQYSGTIFNALKRHHLGSVPIQSAVTKNRGGAPRAHSTINSRPENRRTQTIFVPPIF